MSFQMFRAQEFAYTAFELVRALDTPPEPGTVSIVFLSGVVPVHRRDVHDVRLSSTKL